MQFTDLSQLPSSEADRWRTALVIEGFPQRHITYDFSVSRGTASATLEQFLEEVSERLTRWGLGNYLILEAAQVIADQHLGIDAAEFCEQMERACHEGHLVLRNNGLPVPPTDLGCKRIWTRTVRIDDVNDWLCRSRAGLVMAEPAGMLEAMRPHEAPPKVPMSMRANPAHIATQKQLVEAFKCKPSLFENGRKYPWFLEARTAGTGRRKGTPPMYDPIAFATHLPQTKYGNSITEREAYRALKRHFPEQYGDIEHLIPDDMK